MTRVFITETSLHLKSGASRQVLKDAGLEIARSAAGADWAIAYRQAEVFELVDVVPNIIFHTYEPFFTSMLPLESTYRGSTVYSFGPWTTGLQDVWRHFVIYGRFDYLDPADPARDGMVILATTKSHAHGAFAQDLTAVRHRIAVRAHERGMIDIYGRGWDPLPVVSESRFPKDRSFSEIKHEILGGYRVNLCLENSHARGYVTEKFWQAIRGGCLPVYVGSSWLDEVFPSNDYVDLRDFSNPDDLLDFVKSLSTEEIIARVRRLQQQLRSLEAETDLTLQDVQRVWAGDVARHIRAVEDSLAVRRRWGATEETAAQLAARTGVKHLYEREARRHRAAATPAPAQAGAAVPPAAPAGHDRAPEATPGLVRRLRRVAGRAKRAVAWRVRRLQR